MRHVWTLVTGLIVVVGAQGAPIVSLEAPDSYTPGTAFAVEVYLADVQDLNQYGLYVVLAGDSGAAAVDFDFVSLDDVSTETAWVFYGMPGATRDDKLPLAADDDPYASYLTGVNGINAETSVGATPALLGRLWIQTDATYTGTLTVSIDGDWFELYDAQPQPVAGLSETVVNLPTAVIPVPEPGVCALLAIGLALRWRIKR